MVYTLNLHNVICQLNLNKAGELGAVLQELSNRVYGSECHLNVACTQRNSVEMEYKNLGKTNSSMLRVIETGHHQSFQNLPSTGLLDKPTLNNLCLEPGAAPQASWSPPQPLKASSVQEQNGKDFSASSVAFLGLQIRCNFRLSISPRMGDE